MRSIEDIFQLWPSAAALARAINVPAVTVRQWRNRGYRIPSRYWPDIQFAARTQGNDVPLEAFLTQTANCTSRKSLGEAKRADNRSQPNK
ncbi:carph-isopro domain-containing protein [Flavisphingomonas formosensis]|uniref:carph-isopro domain-containing protein n=1 Tax=Flavisphingomonas formosensis TaxID=861534 RepID=UPI0038CDBEAD